MVQRIPGERIRSGEPLAANHRWREVPDVDDLLISMFVSEDGVGLFIRGQKGTDISGVHRRLREVEQVLRERLEPSKDEDFKFPLAKRHAGDFKDSAQYDVLIPWLAKQADLYERTLREVLAGETEEGDSFGEDDA